MKKLDDLITIDLDVNDRHLDICNDYVKHLPTVYFLKKKETNWKEKICEIQNRHLKLTIKNLSSNLKSDKKDCKIEKPAIAGKKAYPGFASNYS